MPRYQYIIPVLFLLLSACGQQSSEDVITYSGDGPPVACTPSPYANITWSISQKLDANSVVIPEHIQLYGPTHTDQGNIKTVGPRWYWPGVAVTPNTKNFRFDLGLPHVAAARWVLIWKPHSMNNGARLIDMEDNGVNLHEIAEICASTKDHPVDSPRVQYVDITDALNQLRTEGRNVHLGTQMMDDGTPWQLLESRLEIYYEIR